MGKYYFVAQELAKRGIDCDLSWGEGYSFPDEDGPAETWEAAGKGKKQPERIAREQEFSSLYDAYMRPETPLTPYREQCLLDDLYSLLRKLNEDWVHYKAARYRTVFSGVDEDIALGIGCTYAYQQLIQDKAEGIYLEYALAHYLRIAQNKAIDHYFRAEFGRSMGKTAVSTQKLTDSGNSQTFVAYDPLKKLLIIQADSSTPPEAFLRLSDGGQIKIVFEKRENLFWAEIRELPEGEYEILLKK